ncbi:MAG: Dabb family protein [Acidobacteria bacterium]|nr:Dabb family protein [Acidobacteriota bacterium]
MTTRKMLTGTMGAILLFGAGILVGANKFGQPKSVLHVITVRWKADSTEAQRQAAIQGVAKMAADSPGIKNVWLKTLKVQGENYNAAFVMEFQDAKAFEAYANSPAHKAWEEVYLPIRDRSTTHDITN